MRDFVDFSFVVFLWMATTALGALVLKIVGVL